MADNKLILEKIESEAQDQLSDIGWATEKTLGEIKTELKKANKNAKKSGGDNLDDITEELESNTDAVKKGTKEEKKSTKSYTESTKGYERATKEHKKSLKERLGATGPVGEFADKIDSTLKPITSFREGIGAGAAALLTTFANTMLTQASLSEDLYKSGIRFGTNLDGNVNTMQGLQESVNNLGLTSDLVAGMMKESGVAIEQVGMESFTKTARSMEAAGNSLGKSFSETSEYLGEYLERQRAFGVLSDMNSRKDQKKAQEAMVATTQFSQAMRMSTEELEKQLQENAADVTIAEAMSNVAEGSKGAGEIILAATKDLSPQMHQMMKLGLRDLPSLYASPEYKAMSVTQKAAAEETVKVIKGLKEGTIATEDALGRVKDIADQFDASKEAMAHSTAVSVRTDLESTNEAVIAFRKFREQVEAGTYKAAKDPNAELYADIQDAKNRLFGSFEKLAISVLDLFGGLEGVQKGLTKFSNWIEDFSEGMSTVGIVAGVLGIVLTGAVIKKVMSAVFSMSNSIMGGAAKMIGLGKSSSGAASGGVGKAAGAASGGVGKGLSALGKGIAGLGKGAGKMIEATLRGIAMGLSAFNPAVLKGAAIFSAAIILIGGAVSGIAALMGVAMPVLSEGLLTFENLDGEQLSLTGNGMVDLAAGIGAMGLAFGGGAVASALGAVADGIASLFGAGMVDQIAKFADLPNMKTTGDNLSNIATGMTSFSVAMKDLDNADISGVVSSLEALGELDDDQFDNVIEALDSFTFTTKAATGMNVMAVASTNLAASLMRLQQVDLSTVMSSIDRMKNINGRDISKLKRISDVTEKMAPEKPGSKGKSDKSIVAGEDSTSIVELLAEQNSLLGQLVGVNSEQYSEQRKANRTSSFYRR